MQAASLTHMDLSRKGSFDGNELDNTSTPVLSRVLSMSACPEPLHLTPAAVSSSISVAVGEPQAVPPPPPVSRTRTQGGRLPSFDVPEPTDHGTVVLQRVLSSSSYAPAGPATSLGPASDVYEAINGASEFLHTVAAVRRDAMRDTRPLSPEEIKALEANHNVGTWATVSVLASCSAVCTSAIRGCTFSGSVVLGGDYTKEVSLDTGIVLTAGLTHSHINNCIIESNCLVAGTKMLNNVVVQSGAVVFGCGVVTCSGTTSFGNGVEPSLGQDGGGRAVACFAEITVATAAKLAGSLADTALQAQYAEALREYVQNGTAKHTIICSNARVRCCARIVNAFIGPFAVADSCELDSVTILSAADEASSVAGGSVVRQSLLQWGTHVDQLSIVDGSVMCEHSHVDKHGKLLSSLLGPNSGVSEGEVSSSLVGPFVGFHHQALLIAAYWPQGKGNVGYGANVGSNHTSKAPDQEIRPGEGVFFGLGTSIKFPSNFEKSPYTIIATGVTTLPQSVSFPFSLINIPGESVPGLSPAINELFAGWVLADSVYTIWRNEFKFAQRDHARRQRTEPSVFRPEIIDMMIDARRRLQAVKPARLKTDAGEPVYTDREVEGLGKNYLKESQRKAGIESYTFYIQLYALRGLLFGVQERAIPAQGLPPAPATPADRWSHMLAVIAAEFPGVAISDLLKRLADMIPVAIKAALTAKSRDAQRGAAIIPDYNATHPPAAKDKVVLQLDKMLSATKEAVTQLVARL